MIHAFIRFGDGTLCTTCTAETLRRAHDDPAAKFWVDLDRPKDEEKTLLTDVFAFHPLAVEDVTDGHDQRAKLEPYTAGAIEEHSAGYYFLVFHGPDLDTKDSLQTKELDVFIAERYLVTIHAKRLRAVEWWVGKCEKNAPHILDDGIDTLLHSILDKMVDAYFPILDRMQARIDQAEDWAMNRPQRNVLRRINAMKRELLAYRRTIAPQRDVLTSLSRGEVPFIRESVRVYLRDVQDHLTRVVETVELYRDLISGARDVYLSSLSNNLNQVMKTLTIITVVTLPMTVVTSFFGMNFDAIPAIHSRVGFWGTVVFMLGAVAGLLTLFYKKRWI